MTVCTLPMLCLFSLAASDSCGTCAHLHERGEKLATFFLWKGETDEGFNPIQDQKPKLANRPNFLLRPHFSLFPWELAKI